MSIREEKLRIKKFFSTFLVVILGGCLWAQSAFEDGEKLFRQKKYEEAIPYFVQATQKSENPKAWSLYAECYCRTNQTGKCLDIVNKAMDKPGTDKKHLSVLAANCHFRDGDYAQSIEWAEKVMAMDSLYHHAYIIRANAYLHLNKLKEAKADYVRYLELSYSDPQENEIRRLIALLDDEVERLEKEEQARLAEEQRLREEEERYRAEQQRIKEEQERIAAEKAAEERRKQAEREAEEARIAAEKAAEEARLAALKAAEDAERRRRLLEDVAASLNGSGSETMTAGAEDIIDYGFETELE